MLTFSEKFPDQDIIGIKVTEDKILPNGKYIFLDYICANPGCDCKACVIEVIKIPLDAPFLNKNSVSMATIDFYWGKKSRKKETCHVDRQYQISLRKDEKQSEYAKDVLMWFKGLVHDENFVDMIKKRYVRFRRAVLEDEKSTLTF